VCLAEGAPLLILSFFWCPHDSHAHASACPHYALTDSLQCRTGEPCDKTRKFLVIHGNFISDLTFAWLKTSLNPFKHWKETTSWALKLPSKVSQLPACKCFVHLHSSISQFCTVFKLLMPHILACQWLPWLQPSCFDFKYGPGPQVSPAVQSASCVKKQPGW